MDCDLKSSLFRMLSTEELNGLKMKRYDVVFKPGDIIFKQGTAVHSLFSVNSGKVKLFFEDINHNALTFKIAKPGEILLCPGLFTDKRHYFSAMAIEKAILCFVNMEDIKQLIFSNHDFGNEFLKQTNLDVIHFYNRFLSHTRKQMHGKMADALLYLSDEVFDENDSEIKISNQDLAELSGINRDNVVRILKKFSAEKTIQITRNQIKILNLEKLQECSRLG